MPPKSQMSKIKAENINPYNNNESKTEQVENMFDSIAPAYDFMNTAMTFGLHRHWRNIAIKNLKKLPHNSILDVATGTGDVAFKIFSSLQPEYVEGIDLSAGMLEIARKKLTAMDKHANNAIRFSQQDCLNLQFDNDTFDIVTVAYGVRNFEKLAQGYAEMLRVLKPGGTLCVIELSVPKNKFFRFCYNIYSRHIIPTIGKLVSGDSRAYSYLPESIAACPQRDDMTDLMQQAGFKHCSFKTLTFGTVCIYTAKKP